MQLTDKKKSIESFRDQWLDDFFVTGKGHKKIPPDIGIPLGRKLDIINSAVSHKDLRSPPGNRFEKLNPPLGEYCSIRVNGQYRLIFKWIDGKAVDLYLDNHTYRA
ncbi:type II toxin-antitoxin system RelE/ParE family toxin [Serratia marcescens]|uniref:type II toxin-antitoxin system RelE/ParE family toxin n=1 Tax=Serratia TaxID=613 RepID=UPI0007604578|nr:MULTISPECIES: type II toxin-antitoxin system RelE/ParE family toxin [Serratia]EHT9932907.1 type II toxin-antitoxin system RelE/ParE family toxin [Serratia marcescens]EIJ6675271.1 type II toxin-antitoxin system RelE/ParE family toxin [Serratia marcescens]MDR4884260.1 type II toxin-antitoxin system RelE/ParE family toxin [Serratia marcescens]QQU62416.1 type II toxin-antitoxin system RelE/ParE family toxin [Serratia ureilytica]RTF38326.1 type II toxin-antitoxin system RelE/ParE family toxin [S